MGNAPLFLPLLPGPSSLPRLDEATAASALAAKSELNGVTGVNCIPIEARLICFLGLGLSDIVLWRAGDVSAAEETRLGRVPATDAGLE